MELNANQTLVSYDPNSSLLIESQGNRLTVTQVLCGELCHTYRLNQYDGNLFEIFSKLAEFPDSLLPSQITHAWQRLERMKQADLAYERRLSNRRYTIGAKRINQAFVESESWFDDSGSY